MLPEQDGKNIDDLQIITSVLYHPGLLLSAENTQLSGTAFPSSLYMLGYHQQRMLAAVSDLDDAPLAMLESISGKQGLKNIEDAATAALPSGPSKMRLALERDGKLICQALSLNNSGPLDEAQYFPSQFLRPDLIAEDDIKWVVGIGKQGLTPDFTTKHKTNWRSHYSKILEDAPAVDSGKRRAEMLVVNARQEIMEGCITTPYFWQHDKWITPSAHCGGNLGTTRRWALEKGHAVEGVIRKDELEPGQLVVLSNGVAGFGYGRIVTNTTP